MEQFGILNVSSIQNLIDIDLVVSCSPSTQKVTLAYSLAGSQAQTSVWGVPVVLFPV